jgi:hypothetical protein
MIENSGVSKSLEDVYPNVAAEQETGVEDAREEIGRRLEQINKLQLLTSSETDETVGICEEMIMDLRNRVEFLEVNVLKQAQEVEREL